MPSTEIRAFRDPVTRSTPVQQWLDALEQRQPKVYAKCLARILELAEKGFEMRRPHADFLRDGIYELRASFAGINYRLLYGFYAKDAVVLSHGITKQREVPSREIDLAMQRLQLVQLDVEKYTTDIEVE